MNTRTYLKQEVVFAIALSLGAAGLAAPSVATADSVKSGKGEVAQVQGRSSASQSGGGSVSAAGNDHSAFGRGNQSGARIAQKRVDSQPSALELSGRGITPSRAQAPRSQPTTMAANR